MVLTLFTVIEEPWTGGSRLLQESALNDVAVHTLIENMGRPSQGTGVLDLGAMMFSMVGFRIYIWVSG